MTIDCQEIRNLFLFYLFCPVFTWDNFCRRYKSSIMTFLIYIAQVSLAAEDFAVNDFLNEWTFQKCIAELLVAKKCICALFDKPFHT